jgi:hypothetical protein
MSYEIDLSSKNAERLREAFAAFIEKARKSAREGHDSKVRAGTTSGRKSSKTLFSGLEVAEKKQFRAWAKMPTARRVSDAKVQDWI